MNNHVYVIEQLEDNDDNDETSCFRVRNRFTNRVYSKNCMTLENAIRQRNLLYKLRRTRHKQRNAQVAAVAAAAPDVAAAPADHEAEEVLYGNDDDDGGDNHAAPEEEQPLQPPPPPPPPAAIVPRDKHPRKSKTEAKKTLHNILTKPRRSKRLRKKLNGRRREL